MPNLLIVLLNVKRARFNQEARVMVKFAPHIGRAQNKRRLVSLRTGQLLLRLQVSFSFKKALFSPEPVSRPRPRRIKQLVTLVEAGSRVDAKEELLSDLITMAYEKKQAQGLVQGAYLCSGVWPRGSL